MNKILFFLLQFINVVYSCEIAHLSLWECALKNSCMNRIQLHSKTIKSPSNLKRPFILAVEGPRYAKLFKDCDHNNDGCISLNDIREAGQKCERSCIWRSTMKDLLC